MVQKLHHLLSLQIQFVNGLIEFVGRICYNKSNKGVFMDISLSPDNEKFIQKQIADGIYTSINEAINAAINIAIVNTSLSKQIEKFNDEIAIGWQAMEDNDVLDGNLVMEELRKKYVL